MRPTAAFLVTALVLAGGVAGCKAKIGEEDGTDNAAAAAPVSAEGKAEEGKISVKAPGFDLAISLPKEIAGEARVDRDSKVLYPGARIGGMAIAAGPGGDAGGDSEVEMRFWSGNPLDTVAAWYRDPARADGFKLQKETRDGDAVLITGVQNRDRHPFKLRLAPRSGGGTEGRLTVRHHD